MSIIESVLVTIAYTMVNPINFLLLCIMGVILYFKNKDINNMTRRILGSTSKTTIELAISQIVLGIVAGTVLSILMVLFGVSFYENSGIEIVLLITIVTIFSKNGGVNYVYTSIFLLMLNGILNLFKFTGYININTSSLLLFISFYTIIEGILIIIDGRTGAIPVFKKTGNKIIGGFRFNRFWIMPIAVMMILPRNIDGAIKMQVSIDTQWWNLMNITTIIEGLIIGLIALYGKSGYINTTFTQSKARKILTSGGLNIAYGINLFFAIFIVSKLNISEIYLIIYAFITYRLRVNFENNLERKGEYIYTSNDEGLVVLDIAADTIAKNLGIRSGDKIVAINHCKIKSEEEFILYINQSNDIILLSVEEYNGVIKEHKIDLRSNKLGILVVPKLVDESKLVWNRI